MERSAGAGEVVMDSKVMSIRKPVYLQNEPGGGLPETNCTAFVLEAGPEETG